MRSAFEHRCVPAAASSSAGQARRRAHTVGEPARETGCMSVSWVVAIHANPTHGEPCRETHDLCPRVGPLMCGHRAVPACCRPWITLRPTARTGATTVPLARSHRFCVKCTDRHVGLREGVCVCVCVCAPSREVENCTGSVCGGLVGWNMCADHHTGGGERAVGGEGAAGGGEGAAGGGGNVATAAVGGV
jgi:hypothetical protein